MKVASWIFTVLSFLVLIVLIVFAVTFDGDTLVEMILGESVLFCVFGYVGHILAVKYRRVNGGGCTVPYILTFPAYLIPFIVFGVVWLVLYLLNWVLYLVTGRYIIGEFLNWILRDCMGIGGGRSYSQANNGGVEVYVVYDNGYERELTLRETYKQDYENPSLHYDRFIDDVGHYWRSYDGRKTFRKETIEETSRGY